MTLTDDVDSCSSKSTRVSFTFDCGRCRFSVSRQATSSSVEILSFAVGKV